MTADTSYEPRDVAPRAGRPWLKWVGIAVVAFLLMGVGYAMAPGGEPDVAEASPTASPTPTEESTPDPTPVVVEIEVTPQSCLDAIDGLLIEGSNSLTFVSDVLEAYLDYPDENLAEFGARVETIATEFKLEEGSVDKYLADVNACRAAR